MFVGMPGRCFRQSMRYNCGNRPQFVQSTYTQLVCALQACIQCTYKCSWVPYTIQGTRYSRLPASHGNSLDVNAILDVISPIIYNFGNIHRIGLQSLVSNTESGFGAAIIELFGDSISEFRNPLEIYRFIPQVTEDSGYESAVFWVSPLLDCFPRGINVGAVQNR